MPETISYSKFPLGGWESTDKAFLDKFAVKLAAASGVPKKAIGRKMLERYAELKDTAPDFPTSYLCYEEAMTELGMLTMLLNIGPASGYGPDWFIKPKTAEGPELEGLFKTIPSIVYSLDTLPVLGVAVKDYGLDELIDAIDSLMDGVKDGIEGGDLTYKPETSESDWTIESNIEDMIPPLKEDEQTEEEQKPAGKSLKDRVALKGGGELMEDLQTLNKKAQLSFTNLGKRSRKDYYPSKDELFIINQGYSNTELNAEDVLVFTLSSANTAADRQNERFTDNALGDMSKLSLDKAFLIDHKWETTSQVGKIFAAAVQDGQLVQKVYMLNDPMNDGIIKNILAGVYNKVSVGFAANLKDMMCDSCGDQKSIYDSACPHMPGGVDEKGNTTTVSIKSVSDYYEVSLVPIPAQRDAGIRRRGHSAMTVTPEMQKAFNETGNYFAQTITAIADVVRDAAEGNAKALPAEDHASGEVKNLDTINNVKTHLGDQSVPDTTKTDSKAKAADAFETAQATDATGDKAAACMDDEDKALTTGEVAGRVNTELEGEGMDELPNNPAEPAAPAAKPPVYDKTAKKGKKKTLKQLKKLAKGFKKTTKKLEAVAEVIAAAAQKSGPDAASIKQLEQKVEALTKVFVAATTTTIETLEREGQAKRQLSGQAPHAVDANSWAGNLAKGILGGK